MVIKILRDDKGNGEVDNQELGSVRDRIARLKAVDKEIQSDWNTSLTRHKRTKSQAMLFKKKTY